MSPILKRDVSETMRQARRLAGAVTGSPSYEHDDNAPSGSGGWFKPQSTDEVFVTGSDRRKGIGVEGSDVGWEGVRYPDPRGDPLFHADDVDSDLDETEGAAGEKHSKGRAGWEVEVEEGGDGERTRMLGHTSGETRLERLEYEDGMSNMDSSGMKSGQLRDLRNLLCEVSRPRRHEGRRYCRSSLRPQPFLSPLADRSQHHHSSSRSSASYSPVSCWNTLRDGGCSVESTNCSFSYP